MCCYCMMNNSLQIHCRFVSICDVVVSVVFVYDWDHSIMLWSSLEETSDSENLQDECIAEYAHKVTDEQLISEKLIDHLWECETQMRFSI